MCEAISLVGRRWNIAAAAILTLASLASFPNMAARAAATSPVMDRERGKVVTTRPDVSAPESLIRQGNYDEAQQHLSVIDRQYPNDSQTQFLLGMIALQKQDYDRAIKFFRWILAREPNALRVRLELARAYYLKKDFDRSETEFRRATASSHLPHEGVANVERFLSAIVQERRWTTNISFGIAPSSNINSGTGATTVGLYGLPFDLSPDARRQSGVGLNLGLSTEWSPRIAKNLQVAVGGQATGSAFTKTARYNDYTLAGYIGPRLISDNWNLALIGTGFQRWYGNRAYNKGVGSKISGGYMLTQSVVLRASVGFQRVKYLWLHEQDGNVYSAEIGALLNIDPQTRLETNGRFTKQNSKMDAYSNRVIESTATLQHEFRRGYVATVQANVVTVRYDAALAAFGIPRSDNQWSTRLSLYNRGITVLGFSPQLSLIHTTNNSNINLYAFTKNQAEISFVRSF